MSLKTKYLRIGFKVLLVPVRIPKVNIWNHINYDSTKKLGPYSTKK
jgi:hypothetical protein